MAKEFEKAAYDGAEPSDTAMGASKINYGEQRFGVGVTEDEKYTYCEPGSEGANMLSIQIGNGGIGSQSKSEE